MENMNIIDLKDKKRMIELRNECDELTDTIIGDVGEEVRQAITELNNLMMSFENQMNEAAERFDVQVSQLQRRK